MATPFMDHNMCSLVLPRRNTRSSVRDRSKSPLLLHSAIVRNDRNHPLSVPPLPAVSSLTVSVQVPAGSSPMNAPRASSGASSATAPEDGYGWSEARPKFVEYGSWPPWLTSSRQTVPENVLALV